MLQLQRGLLSLFRGQLLFQCFLFSLTLLDPLCDPLRGLALFHGNPQVFNGLVCLPDGFPQILNGQIFTACLTGLDDFLRNDLDSLRCQKLRANISDLPFKQILGDDLLVAGFLLGSNTGVIMIYLSQFAGSTVSDHGLAAMTTEQLRGQQIIILGLCFPTMHTVRCDHVLDPEENVVIYDSGHTVGSLDSVVGIVADISSIP